MRLFTSALAAILVAAGVSAAAAQAPASSATATVSLPRIELGGGFTSAIPLSTDSEGFGMVALLNVRAGVALTRRWALEGAFDIMPGASGSTVLNRGQARWQTKADAAPGSLRTHVTFGASGWFNYRSYPESSWQDASGAVHVYPARTYWNAGPPVYPTVGFGAQKTLGAHVALRADLAAIVVPADDFVAVILMPTISVSIPIGRYPRPTKR